MLVAWPLVWAFSRVRLRWYWFHLAMQVGFLLREMFVISVLDGWHWQVITAQAAMWLTLLLVLGECWRFSQVRETGRNSQAVDQVLDMLLLPVNYGFFCGLCVRILRLQRDHQNRGMVSAAIESADIWEAWALWSVLELFVRVVEAASSRDPRRVHDAEYRETIKAFKALSLQGVKAWVFILTCTITVNVLMKGAVAVFAPTLCYWMYKECTSCEEWYHKNISLAAQSVIFILCSFALVFVFTFERVFEEYLHSIQPFWKFWGVKGVVSVTYFQWLIISYCFGLDEDGIYLTHCLLCSLEMPLLSVLHATCAYPYGKPWLGVVLDTARGAEEKAAVLSPRGSTASAVEMQVPAEVVGVADSPRVQVSEREARALAALGDEEEDSRACSSPTVADMGMGVVDPEPEDDKQPLDGPLVSCGSRSQESLERHDDCLSLVFFVFLWTLTCVASTRFIFWLAPVENDIEEAEPVYDLTCNGESALETFVKEHEALHWSLPQAVRSQFRRGVPLCSVATLDCALGFKGRPNVTCSARGTYTFQGHCKASECGAPPWLPHATVNWEDQARQDWTFGMRVSYDCKKGYRGNPVAICGKETVGKYKVEGTCQEVACGRPPQVRHAVLLANNSNGTLGSKWHVGTKVYYHCHEGYVGQPTALCSDEGVYVLSGRCMLDCGPPPSVENAVAQYDNELATLGFIVGVRVRYNCTVGHGGEVVAICGKHGNYSVEGFCSVICGPPLGLNHATPLLPAPEDLTKHQWAVGMRVAYRCDPGYRGLPVAECGQDGYWQLHAKTSCQYTGCGKLSDFLVTKLGKSWSRVLREDRTYNVTPDGFQDVVSFACQPGLTGMPLATCLQGNWSLTGSCNKIETSSGCKCRTDWASCQGWFRETCQAWHGCDVRSTHSYGWCQVVPKSCPVSARGLLGYPSWDYCSDGNSNVTWPHEDLPGRMVAPGTQVVLGAVGIASLILLSLSRWVRAPRGARDAELQFQTREEQADGGAFEVALERAEAALQERDIAASFEPPPMPDLSSDPRRPMVGAG